MITMHWSAPTDLLAKAIIFQSLKFLAGITLFSRLKVAPYLLAAVLLWSLVVTGLGFQVHPLADQSTFSIVYVAIHLVLLLAVVLYSFRLKSMGYFAGGPNA